MCRIWMVKNKFHNWTSELGSIYLGKLGSFWLFLSAPVQAASNFKSFSRPLEQFFLTVGQNNFGNKIPFQKLNLELEENEGIIGDKPTFDQDRDWKAKLGIEAGLFTLNSRPKAIRWSHLLFWSECWYEFFRNSAAICFHRQQNLISVNIWNSLEFFLNSWWLRKLMTTESFKNSAATCFSYEMSLDFFMIFWMFEKAYDNGILPRILMRKLEGFSFLAICTKLQKNFQIWNVFKVID